MRLALFNLMLVAAILTLGAVLVIEQIIEAIV
jgi:hypothetical protein